MGQCITLPRLFALYKYWSTNPPTHMIARTFVKIEKPKPKEEAAAEAAAFASQMPRMTMRRPRG